MVESDRGEGHNEPISKGRYRELHNSYGYTFFSGALGFCSIDSFAHGTNKLGVCAGIFSLILAGHAYDMYNQLRNP